MKETLASNLEELHRIARIVADMLFLANAQRGAQASREALTELRELITEVLDGLAKNGEAGNGKVETSVRKRVKALTDRFPIYG